MAPEAHGSHIVTLSVIPWEYGLRFRLRYRSTIAATLAPDGAVIHPGRDWETEYNHRLSDDAIRQSWVPRFIADLTVMGFESQGCHLMGDQIDMITAAIVTRRQWLEAQRCTTDNSSM